MRYDEPIAKVLYLGFEKTILRSGNVEARFEHINFYPSLLQVPGIIVDYFKLDRMNEVGAAAMSREIMDHVTATKPDVIIMFAVFDLDKETFRAIARDSQTVTVGIFTDDDTDLYRHSLPWAGVFDWTVTFYPPAFDEYRKRGVNVVGINWAANPDFWKPPAAEPKKDIDISFIGAAKDERKAFVSQLLARGIAVECYGAGWPNGPVSFERMREVIGRSKVNLNLGLGKPIMRWRTLIRIFVSPREDGKSYYFDLRHVVSNFKIILNRRRPMGRARPFELAAAGGFVLTNRDAPLFGEPFIEGKEMVTYIGVDDAAQKIRYYLAPEHEAERETIARAGYERAIRDQSFKKRVVDILALIAKDPKPKRPMANVLA